MKILLFKLAFIFLVVFVWFEIAFGIVLPKMIRASNDSYLNRWKKFYTEVTGAEIICLGSSRVHRHCNPAIISGITHLTTEVIAAPDTRVDVYERLYEDYLKHNPRPKVLLVGIDLTGLDSLVRMPFPEYFFPFIHVSDHLSEMSEFNLIKYHKPLGYFYYKEIYIDLLESPDMQQHVNGFQVRDIQWDWELENFIKKYPNGYTFNLYQPTLKKIFQFLAKEQKAGVQCSGFIAPEFHEVWRYENNRQTALEMIYRNADSAGISVWNFSDSSYKPCFKRELFYNSQHLNKAGSDIFSKDLSDSVLRCKIIPGKT